MNKELKSNDMSSLSFNFNQISELNEVYTITTVTVDSSITNTIRKAYTNDTFFGSVVTNLELYPVYSFKDSLIYY